MKRVGNIFFGVLLAFAITYIFFSLPLSVESASTGTITATVAVGICGNNIVEYGENCDGSALDGQTCLSLGYDGGTLSCGIGCDFDVSECVNFGPDEGSAVFSGKAYPSSAVKILKDGQIAATTASDSNGNFETTLSNLIVGSYTFAVYAYDSNGNKSKTVTYRKEITKDEIEEISGIIIPPTLETDDDEVEKGEEMTFSGQAVPLSAITIYLFSEKESWSFGATAGSNGYYSYDLDTDDFDEDDYWIYAKATISGQSSEYGEEVSFEISEDSESESALAKGYKKVDFNEDYRVNIIDFSMMVHWFDRSNFPVKIDVNIDEKVNLSDFSVMMYYWTG